MRDDPVTALRAVETPEVVRLIKASERLGELADIYNGIIHGLIIPGDGRNKQMLRLAYDIPGDGIHQRRLNLQLHAKRLRKGIERVLALDEAGWPDGDEEEE